MSGRRAPALAIVEGRPELVLRDDDREAVAELVAEELIAAIEREDAEGRGELSRDPGAPRNRCRA